MIPPPALQERVKYLRLLQFLRRRALVSLKDFAAEPRRKQVVG